ncbi:MAG: alpha/beta fold hydrolase, partial [Thermoplasmata archaeon]|nr:alpha/beta fold hydrolase [Thermoplasmata archaeon]
MATPPSPKMTLHVREAGSGPAIVLLHGLGGDHTVWEAQLSGLASDFRVLAPDLRGHGRSVAPEGSTFSFAEMIGDVAGML